MNSLISNFVLFKISRFQNMLIELSKLRSSMRSSEEITTHQPTLHNRHHATSFPEIIGRTTTEKTFSFDKIIKVLKDFRPTEAAAEATFPSTIQPERPLLMVTQSTLTSDDTDEEIVDTTSTTTLSPHDRVLNRFLKRNFKNVSDAFDVKNLTIKEIRKKFPDHFKQDKAFDYDFEDDEAKDEHRKKFLEYYEVFQYYFEDSPNITIFETVGETTHIVEMHGDDEETTTLETASTTTAVTPSQDVPATELPSRGDIGDESSALGGSQQLSWSATEENIFASKKEEGESSTTVGIESSTAENLEISTISFPIAENLVTFDPHTTHEATTGIPVDSSTLEIETSTHEAIGEKMLAQESGSVEVSTEKVRVSDDVTSTSEATSTFSLSSLEDSTTNLISVVYERSDGGWSQTTSGDSLSTTIASSTPTEISTLQDSTTDSTLRTTAETITIETSTMEDFLTTSTFSSNAESTTVETSTVLETSPENLEITDSTTEGFTTVETSTFHESTTDFVTNGFSTTAATTLIESTTGEATTQLDGNTTTELFPLIDSTVEGKSIDEDFSESTTSETSTTVGIGLTTSTEPSDSSTSPDETTEDLRASHISTVDSTTVETSTLMETSEFQDSNEKSTTAVSTIESTTVETSTAAMTTGNEDSTLTTLQVTSTEKVFSSDMSTTVDSTTLETSTPFKRSAEDGSNESQETTTSVHSTTESTTFIETSTKPMLKDEIEYYYEYEEYDVSSTTEHESTTEDVQSTTEQTTTASGEIDSTTESIIVSEELSGQIDSNKTETIDYLDVQPKKDEIEYYYVYEEYEVDAEPNLPQAGNVTDSSPKQTHKQRRDNSFEYYVDSISASEEFRSNGRAN